jgi:hypothetical protein
MIYRLIAFFASIAEVSKDAQALQTRMVRQYGRIAQ